MTEIEIDIDLNYDNKIELKAECEDEYRHSVYYKEMSFNEFKKWYLDLVTKGALILEKLK